MTRRRLPLALSFALALGFALGSAAALPGAARANGNVSHQWISVEAAELTPEGGSLRALVGDASLSQELYTGTMFPDWGYTPGASAEERNAGEASHWEYVQEAYRLWILDNYAHPPEQPWSTEARRHLAFYMGMTSHGMADQTYDAMFFERSRFYEQKDHGSFDQQSDVLWAAKTGPGEVPTAWIPEAQMLSIFGDVVGEDIDGENLKQRVGLMGGAIAAVNAISGIQSNVDAAAAEYPWAAAHDDDPEVPGNPPSEAEAVRRYWQSNWALIHGDPLPRPVLWTFPVDGGTEHEVMSSSIESWVTVVFARGIDAALLDPGSFHLVDSTGLEVPVDVNLFYGNSSHAVHLKPMQDLIDDEVYVVTIDPGVATIHGEQLEGWDFTFTTGLDAPAPLHDDGEWDSPDPYGDEDPGGGDDGGDDGSGADSGDDDAAGTGDDGDTAGGSDKGKDGGCAVNPARDQDPRHLALLALALLALRPAWGRRARHARHAQS